MKTPTKTQRVKTLLVHGSAAARRTLAAMLARDGRFSVVGVACDGCQALHQALSLAPELVLIGLDLPRLSGARVAQYIKHFESPPVVLMLAPQDSPGCRAISEAAGADDLIVKSTDLYSQLKEKLRRVLAGSRDASGIR